MGNPWEDYKAAPTEKETMPWEDHAAAQQQQQKHAVSKTRDTQLSDFIPDKNTVDALTAGINDGSTLGYGANSVAAQMAALDAAKGVDLGFAKKNYINTRDQVQKHYDELDRTNVIGRGLGKAIGGLPYTVALPFTKMAQGMTQGMSTIGSLMSQGLGMAADGFVTGAVTNPGNTPGQTDGPQLAERLSNANFGAAVAPAFGMAAKAATSLPEIGQALKGQAQRYAYFSSAPRLADRRVDRATGMDKEIGKYMIENEGYVKPFGSTASVAEEVVPRIKQTGSRLDDLYLAAQEKFGNAQNKPGYDPIADKAEMMQNARASLHGTEGKEAALVRFEKYLDQMSSEHGNSPNQALSSKYQQDVQEYAPKYRNFLKNKKEYRSSVGQAGDNLEQPILDGMQDTLQTTSQRPIRLETIGKDSSVAVAEPYETWTQGNLSEPNLPTRPVNNAFNPGREVDNLMPLSHKVSIDRNYKTAMHDTPYAPQFSPTETVGPANPIQSEILGLQNTPRSYMDAEIPTLGTKNGQTKMILETPVAPTRPTRPEQVRNPMGPRQMNDYKGSMDDVLNYNRNPDGKVDPALEKAFYSGRKTMSGKIDNSIEELGGQEMKGELKSANKAYQIESKIKKYSTDQVNRDDVNKPLSLTNAILAMKSIPYAMAKGAGEKFGYQTLASTLNPLGNLLQKTPAGLQILNKQAPEIQNMMLQRYLKMKDEEK